MEIPKITSAVPDLVYLSSVRTFLHIALRCQHSALYIEDFNPGLVIALLKAYSFSIKMVISYTLLCRGRSIYQILMGSFFLTSW